MAFPYTTITNFEDGTKGSFFGTETDANAGLDYPHYSTLARIPGMSMPWRGAYCMRLAMATVSTAGAYIQDATNLDQTAGTNDAYILVKFWLSKDMAMSNNDVFNLIDFRSGADVTPHTDGTAEAVCSVKYTTASGWQIGIGETAPTVLTSLTLGEWHTVELFFDPAGGTGTIDAWFDGKSLTQVATLTNANIQSVAVGAVPGAAFTPTAGTLLVDHVIGHLDGARIGGTVERFPETLELEASGHVFVGHGILDNVSLLSGGAADNVLILYDTDEANTTTATRKLTIKNLSSNETPVDPAGVPIQVKKGAYLSLSGTNPRAMVNIHRAMGYGGDGAIRTVAAQRS